MRNNRVLGVAALAFLAAFSAGAGGLQAVRLGDRPAKQARPAHEETVWVEEPLTAAEIAEAQAAARARAIVGPDGLLRVPKVATTRKVAKPKAEVYAPPAEVAADAKRLVHWFCARWKEEAYERMYYAMAPDFRARVPYATFARRLRDDAALTGGLNDESIREEVEPAARGVRVTVTLRFNWPKAGSRTAHAELVRVKEGFRVAESGLVPNHYD